MAVTIKHGSNCFIYCSSGGKAYTIFVCTGKTANRKCGRLCGGGGIGGIGGIAYDDGTFRFLAVIKQGLPERPCPILGS